MRGIRRAALALLLLPSATAVAQDSQPVETGIELTPATQQALLRLQEQWLQWVSAFFQNDPAQAERVVDELTATARQLGLPRLPDLSLAAQARAVEAARAGHFERANWALVGAERLDPERPETAFASAVVSRWKGLHLLAARQHLMGYARGWRLPPVRRMAVHGTLVWTCCALLLASGLFVGVLMAFKGGALHRDLARLVGRRLPPGGASAVALVLLLWPLALPSGVLWLALYWSVLLWGYSTHSERLALALVWLIAGTVPMLVARAQRQLVVELSPPGRVIDQITHGRMSGSLFTELGVLRTQLPDSLAARQLLADLHRRLGQWEIARPLYAEVVEAEPQNAPAILGLGAYYFRKGDFGKAIDLYRQATAAEGAKAAAYFNLSLAFSESYLFNESRLVLAQARAHDDRRVGEWIQHAPPDRVVTPDGGFARAAEIRGQLAAEARRRGGSRQLLRGWLSLPVAAVFALGAVTLHLARRRSGYSAPPPVSEASGPRRWLRALLPGWAAAAEGRGMRLYLELLAVAAILLFLPGLGVRVPIPWGFAPGDAAAWSVVVLALAALLGMRARRAWRLREV
jgi:tetratricopeptide (TPR) repeat protein